MSRSAVPASALVRRAAIRLGVQATVLAAALVVLVSTAALVVVMKAQDRAAAADLDVAVVRADDLDDPPAWTRLAIRGSPDAEINGVDPNMPPGLPDTAAMDRVAAGGPTEVSTTSSAGGDYLVETRRQPTGATVQGVLDLVPSHAARLRLVRALLIAAAGGMLLAGFVGTWLGRRALAPLSTALEVQRRFVADAGHELRTPVTLLHTRAQLVRRGLRRDGAGDIDRGALTADVDGLVADSGRLGDILEELLLAADPGATSDRRQIELTALAREVAATADAQATTRGVTLTGPAPDAAPVEVAGLPVALRRAVTALVDNAVRHAERDVRVTVTRSGRDAVVDVVDDGPGIDPEVAPRVFDRFATGRAGPGTVRRYGIGLSLVNEIVTAHGGRVELVHRSGPGSTLRITLPRGRRVR